MRFIALLLLFPLFNGCLSPARRLESSAVDRIKEGISTRKEIEQQFGKPENFVVGSNHKTVAEYSSAMDSPPSATLERRMYLRTLSLLYGPGGVVEKVVRYESSRAIHRSVTDVSIGSPTLSLDWIIKGKTTSNAVITARGLPDFKTLTPEGGLVLGWSYARRERGNRLSIGEEKFLLLVDPAGVVMDFQLRAASVPVQH